MDLGGGGVGGGSCILLQESLWAAERVHAFGSRINRGGSAAASKKRQVVQNSAGWLHPNDNDKVGARTLFFG